MKSRAIAIVAAAVLVVAGIVVDAAPSSALYCGLFPVSGQGSPDHGELEASLFIPAHDSACASATGMVSYQSTSQADAVNGVLFRTTPFAGLDQPLTAEQWLLATTSTSQPGSRTSTVLHLPMYMQGFAITYSITACPMSDPLKLTPLTLGLIYSGAATTWGDRAIVRDNPGLTGCTQPIFVGVRQGGSWGTTVVQDYISKQLPAFKAYKDGQALTAWPPSLSVGCQAPSEASMTICAANPGAIGYMSYKSALDAGLSIATIANSNGVYLRPGEDGDTWPTNCADAASAQTTYPPAVADWSTVSLTYASNGYGLCAFSYLLAFQTMRSAGWNSNMAQTVQDHLLVATSDSVQGQLSGMGYAPLPTFMLLTVRAAAANMITT